MTTRFISDLHLHPSRPHIINAFVAFLDATRGETEALYILGDLFEAWIGDDHPETAFQPVKAALERCNASGTPVSIMHGNRDFLIGESFTRETGCLLLDDPTVVDFYGVRTLLMHGDSLCTDDKEYQQLRRDLRNPEWQRRTLALSVEERLQLAHDARELSVLSSRDKEEYIMDVNQDEVLRSLTASGAQCLIHGHTHRPGKHEFQHAGRTLQRIVLGDWYEHGSVLELDANRCDLRTLPIH
jgi:UDP-2,3-diacylglucosamine hydrolase